ncbi:MAG: hypothetical protein H6977_15800 [Gammaproteobacteria bacterium]|nr:hypothetical protein [Planctomycetota bacterium]MCB1748819.1 hypothetical protein [Gammaproteobacteria bacterium]MCP5201466.1 hypothetical protein [Gammaproteobacteria bacterium]
MTGVEHGQALLAFASAVLGSDRAVVASARDALAAAMGPAAVTSAALTAGVFSLVDRAANGVGIPVEPMVMKPSADFRARYGIDEYPSARNSIR